MYPSSIEADSLPNRRRVVYNALMSRTRICLMVVVLVVCLFIPGWALAGEPVYSEVLPNGVTVLMQTNLASPTVSVNVFVKTGGFEETDETMGIAHFYEHLFFRGTPTLSGYQFKRAIEAIGGTTNAQTGKDYTHYYINLPRQYAEQGVRLLADALVNAEFDPEAIDQERKAVLEEYRLDSESPIRSINYRLSEMVYGDHPYHRPIIGTEENIRRFTKADFIKFRDSFVSPERVTVVIVGDLEANQLLPVIRSQFGEFTRPGARAILRPGKVSPPAEAVHDVEAIPAKNSFVVYGWVGPSVKDQPDIYRTDVLAFMLGIGRGAMARKRLVDSGEALDAGVEFRTSRFAGLFTVYAIGPAGQETKLQEQLLGLIEDVKAGNFTDRDLQRAKSFLRGSNLLGNESNAGKAGELGYYASIDTIAFADNYLVEIDKVTKADVMAAASQYLNSKYCSFIMKGRTAQEEEARKQAAEVERERERTRQPSRSWGTRH